MSKDLVRADIQNLIDHHTALIESGLLDQTLEAYVEKLYYEHDLKETVAKLLEEKQTSSATRKALSRLNKGRIPSAKAAERLKEDPGFAGLFEEERRRLPYITRGGWRVNRETDLFHSENGRSLILPLCSSEEQEIASYLKGNNHMKAFLRDYTDILFKKYSEDLIDEGILHLVIHGLAEYISIHGVNYQPLKKRHAITLTGDLFPDFFENYDLYFLAFLKNYIKNEYIPEEICRRLPSVHEAEYIADYRLNRQSSSLTRRLTAAFYASPAYLLLLEEVCASVTQEKFLDILIKTKRYRQVARDYRYRIYTLSAMTENIVTAIPKQLKDLYPAARRLHRHFVLHTGPTNSGKTYEAMQALRESINGMYLAPLRMLALEKFDEMNEAGFPCSLLTGEEEKVIEGAAFRASTIEMADFNRLYECAVIDECQMITDEFRGGAWTAAILGLQALEIHLCLSPWAKDMLISLIRTCGDSYEIVEHVRTTDLIAEDKPLRGIRQVRDHDALIAFSRKSVHAIASALEKRGMPCSIIYGSLPYDVRQNEAEKFRTGITKVVVATDAIGMGMNLPIERIVFMEMTKFDGKARRDLNMEEIRQIAGRAGRRGLYETGYVTTTTEEGNTLAADALNRYLEEIPKPMTDFPPSLLGLEGSVSDIMKGWDAIPPIEGFGKENIAETIHLAEEAEKLTDDKMMVYRLSSVALDSNSEEQMAAWTYLADLMVRGHLADAPIPEIPDRDSLKVLETMHKVYDVYFQFGRIFEYTFLKEAAAEKKEETSGLIIRYLDKNGKEARVCRRCGRALPWDARSAICDRCYAYSGRYYRYGRR